MPSCCGYGRGISRRCSQSPDLMYLCGKSVHVYRREGKALNQVLGAPLVDTVPMVGNTRPSNSLDAMPALSAWVRTWLPFARLQIGRGPGERSPSEDDGINYVYSFDRARLGKGTQTPSPCPAPPSPLGGDWRVDYNQERPHSSLGYLAPQHFGRQGESCRVNSRLN